MCDTVQISITSRYEGENIVLIDELKELIKKTELEGCVVGVWVQVQDAEFQEVFNLLRHKPNVNLTQALDLVKKYHPSLPFKRTSFVMHMRGTCTCPTA